MKTFDRDRIEAFPSPSTFHIMSAPEFVTKAFPEKSTATSLATSEELLSSSSVAELSGVRKRRLREERSYATRALKTGEDSVAGPCTVARTRLP